MKPDFLLIGGPNGAGKSTIYTAIQEHDATGWILDPIRIPAENFINADLIARESDLNDVEAGRNALSMFKDYADRKCSFAFESTLAGRSNTRRIRELRDGRGYRIITVFVWLRSAELSMARVTHRATKGKHYIPMERVLARHSKSIRHFVDDTIPLCDIWVIVDNSGDVPTICGWGGRAFDATSYKLFTENITAADRFVQFYQTGRDPCLVNRYSETTECVSPFTIERGDDLTQSILGAMQSKVADDLRSRPVGTSIVFLSEQNSITWRSNKSEASCH